MRAEWGVSRCRKAGEASGKSISQTANPRDQFPNRFQLQGFKCQTSWWFGLWDLVLRFIWKLVRGNFQIPTPPACVARTWWSVRGSWTWRPCWRRGRGVPGVGSVSCSLVGTMRRTPAGSILRRSSKAVGVVLEGRPRACGRRGVGCVDVLDGNRCSSTLFSRLRVIQVGRGDDRVQDRRLGGSSRRGRVRGSGR